MVFQMPIFICLYNLFHSAIEIREAHILPGRDLTKSDTQLRIPSLCWIFHLLPLIMVATMLWQAHITPPSPGLDPMQQKLMRYMPLMFMVFLYNYSAALTLYWT